MGKEEINKYEKITKLKYQNKQIAYEYVQEYEGRVTFNNLHQKVITYREIKIIEKFIEKIEKKLNLIMDIPCGSAKLKNLLSNKSFKFIGGDISKEMLDLAQTRYKNSKNLINLLRLDGMKIPLLDNSVDLIISLRLLHRVPDIIKVKLLQEYIRVSRKYVIISFGQTSRWQKLRLKMRNQLSNRESVPYPILELEMLNIIKSLNSKIISIKSVLPLLSAEKIILIKK